MTLLKSVEECRYTPLRRNRADCLFRGSLSANLSETTWQWRSLAITPPVCNAYELVLVAVAQGADVEVQAAQLSRLVAHTYAHLDAPVHVLEPGDRPSNGKDAQQVSGVAAERPVRAG